MDNIVKEILWDNSEKCPGYIVYRTRALDSSGDGMTFYWDKGKNRFTDDGFIIDTLSYPCEINESLYQRDATEKRFAKLLNDIARKYFCNVNEELELVCDDPIEKGGLIEIIQAATAITAYVQTHDMEKECK